MLDSALARATCHRTGNSGGTSLCSYGQTLPSLRGLASSSQKPDESQHWPALAARVFALSGPDLAKRSFSSSKRRSIPLNSGFMLLSLQDLAPLGAEHRQIVAIATQGVRLNLNASCQIALVEKLALRNDRVSELDGRVIQKDQVQRYVTQERSERLVQAHAQVQGHIRGNPYAEVTIAHRPVCALGARAEKVGQADIGHRSNDLGYPTREFLKGYCTDPYRLPLDLRTGFSKSPKLLSPDSSHCIPCASKVKGRRSKNTRPRHPIAVRQGLLWVGRDSRPGDWRACAMMV